MKLSEITTPTIDKKVIEDNIRKYGLNPASKVHINTDGTVDVMTDVFIKMQHYDEIKHVGNNFVRKISPFEKFDVQFGTVSKSFTLQNCPNLISLKGCPTRVEGIFRLTHCPGVNSLEYAPAWIGGNCVIGGNGPKIKDFGSIKYVGGKLTFIDTSIVNLIKVLDIGGVKEVDCGNKKINEILNKYLKQPVIHKRDMLGFQDEMIEAGFSGYVEVE